jgi:hypothetical protein
VLTYVTPVFLIVMMLWWSYVEAIPKLMLEGVPEDERAIRTASRLVMVGILVLQIFLIRYAWARKARKEVA